MLFNYISVDDVLNEKECEEIINYSQDDMSKSRVGDDLKFGKIRNSTNSFLNPGSLIDEHIEKVLKSFFWVAKEGYKLPLQGVESIQFTDYKIGSYYDWHVDTSSDDMNMDRDISASLILSDRSNYEGGELQFKDIKNDEGEGHIVEEKRGKLIVFPSMMMHRVRKVTKGRRNSLVMWGLRTTA